MTVSERGPRDPPVELSKRFGDVRAVDDVSLEIRAGEFFSLLGPSGCGKTTTLRMIGGFELPTNGTDRAARGRDVTTDPPDKRPVNMVFQSYALFPHLNVGDNVAFGLRRHKVGEAEIRRGSPRRSSWSTSRLRASASRTSCRAASSSGSRSPGRWSTGPRCCCSTSRSARSTSSCAGSLQLELKRIQTEVGITFVYVTHDQEEALTMSDRIAVMHAGQGRAARHARRSSTSGRRPGSWPTSSARRTCSRARSSRSTGPWPRSASTAAMPAGRRLVDGLAPGDAVEISVRPEGDRHRPPGQRADGRHRGPRRAGRLPGCERAVPGPHAGRRCSSTVIAPKIRPPARRSATMSTSQWSADDALVLGGHRPTNEEETCMSDRARRPRRRPRAGS